MDLLAIMISRLYVLQVLQCLPSEINDIYDEALKKIDGQIGSDAKLAQKVLC